MIVVHRTCSRCARKFSHDWHHQDEKIPDICEDCEVEIAANRFDKVEP